MPRVDQMASVWEDLIRKDQHNELKGYYFETKTPSTGPDALVEHRCLRDVPAHCLRDLLDSSNLLGPGLVDLRTRLIARAALVDLGIIGVRVTRGRRLLRRRWWPGRAPSGRRADQLDVADGRGGRGRGWPVGCRHSTGPAGGASRAGPGRQARAAGGATTARPPRVGMDAGTPRRAGGRPADGPAGMLSVWASRCRGRWDL